MLNNITYYRNYLEKIENEITKIELTLWKKGHYNSNLIIDKKLKALKIQRTKLYSWINHEKITRYKKENSKN